MRELSGDVIAAEQLRQVVRVKMECMIRLLQRALNHERLSDGELSELASGCEWIWSWAANVERE